MNFTLFGRPLGLIALSALSRLLGFEALSWTLVGLSLLALVYAAWQARSMQVADLLHNPDMGYASWIAATVSEYSLFLPASIAIWVWFSSLLLASLFMVIWMLRLAEGTGLTTFDPATVAWPIPWVVCDLTAPAAMRPASHLFGAVGAVLSTGVLVVATLRVRKRENLLAMRSLWYGVGGSGVLVLWVHAAGFRPPMTEGLIALFAVIGLVWLACVFLVGFTSHGAWSNLFSLCSSAKAMLALGAVAPANAVFAVALATLVVDLRTTTWPMLAPLGARLRWRRKTASTPRLLER
jgi:hypothetical protein